MFANRSRASLALQIARAAVPPAALGVLVLVVSACEAQNRTATRATAPEAASLTSETDDGTYFGPSVPLNPGAARTYVMIERGVPTEIGVELNEGALKGLPTTGEQDGHHNMQHMMETAWDLPLPSQAATTAYKSVYFGWMPFGHKPPYDRPHFDFHFYVVPTADRLAIDRADPQYLDKAVTLPSQEYWPARYLPLNILLPTAPIDSLAVPKMGLHWLDLASPELNGAEFRYTLFYGSWNGRIIFDEPMITKAVLESRESVNVTLPPAARYASEGLRAGGYRVYYDESTDRHRVALTQLASR